MGCKGLWAFLNDILEEVSIDKLRGKPIIVDIMLYIYKYTIGIRNTGYDIISTNGENLNHIYAIYNLIKNFSDNGILPICVFDGKSPELKKDSVEKRKQIAEMADEKCKQLMNQTDIYDIDDFEQINSEYIKNFKKSFSINSNIIDECKYLLESFGIPYIDSLGEADSQCTALSHYYKTIVSGVLSEDSDILIFGGHSLFRDFDLRNNRIKLLELEKILNYLQNKTNEICHVHFKKSLIFTMDNFIDFTIILGNDYGHGVRCSGGNNREKLFELFVLNEFNVVNYIAHLYQINKEVGYIKYYIPENFIEKWVHSKNNYKLAEIIDPSEIDICMKKPNFEDLSMFLINKKVSKNQIDYISNSLKKLYELYSKKNFKYAYDKDNDVNDVNEVNEESNEDLDDGWIQVKRGKKIC
jgi:5'-3' exonuclease